MTSLSPTVFTFFVPPEPEEHESDHSQSDSEIEQKVIKEKSSLYEVVEWDKPCIDSAKGPLDKPVAGKALYDSNHSMIKTWENLKKPIFAKDEALYQGKRIFFSQEGHKVLVDTSTIIDSGSWKKLMHATCLNSGRKLGCLSLDLTQSGLLGLTRNEIEKVRELNQVEGVAKIWLYFIYINGQGKKKMRLVVELCNRRSLFKTSVNLNFSHIRSIFKQLLITLQEFSIKGFIHRDIKPSNVVLHEIETKEAVEQPYQAKLTDLATCRTTLEDVHLHETTPEYATPKYALLLHTKKNLSSAVCHQLDIWSLAITMIDLCAFRITGVWTHHFATHSAEVCSDLLVDKKLASLKQKVDLISEHDPLIAQLLRQMIHPKDKLRPKAEKLLILFSELEKERSS